MCLNMMRHISRFSIGVLLTAVSLTVSTTAAAEMIPPPSPEGVTPPGQVYELPALPTAAGDHQRFNAKAMVSAGASLMYEEGKVTGAELWRDVTSLFSDSVRLEAMAEASRGRGRPHAAGISGQRCGRRVERGGGSGGGPGG